ncbi:hypothetical protein CsatA_010194 [Cannabis sativa]
MRDQLEDRLQRAIRRQRAEYLRQRGRSLNGILHLLLPGLRRAKVYQLRRVVVLSSKTFLMVCFHFLPLFNCIYYYCEVYS